jgi:peptidoglycan/xylan/chitin deacetylase (PgdA/CDA1 family)
MGAHPTSSAAAAPLYKPESNPSVREVATRWRAHRRVSSTEAIKAGVFAVGRASGIFNVVRDSAWRSSRLLILCYHGISQADEHRALRELYVSADLFRRRLVALRDGGYNVLALGDAIDRLKAGTLPRRSVVLTFDDGFVDFYRVAYPILAEFGYPATVYVATEYVESQLPAFPAILTYLLWMAGETGTANDASVDGIALGTRNEQEQSETVDRLMAKVDSENIADAHERDLLAGRVAKQLGIDYAELKRRRLFQLMTHDELRALDRNLIDVQLHTHRHQQPNDPNQFAREIADNRSSLAAAGLQPLQLNHFCYPNGEVRPELPGWLKQHGVRSATTCVPGIVDSGCDPLLMPRFIDTHHVSPMKFEAWLCGAAALLPRRSR